MRRGWPSDFPLVALHAPEKLVKQHPAYAAAKAGDMPSAAILVKDMADIEVVSTLVATHQSSHPTLLPVYAIESAGNNPIPQALAHYIAARSGWDVDDQIVQANWVGRTGRDGYYRLAVQPRFAGKVQVGEPYLLVDDFLGQGATLANLRGHVLTQGGRVVGATALTGKAHSAKLALQGGTLLKLRSIHGKLEIWWRDQFRFGFDQFTESEARYLIARTDADRVRAEVIARLDQGG